VESWDSTENAPQLRDRLERTLKIIDEAGEPP
jgi:hypothetical protein